MMRTIWKCLFGISAAAVLLQPWGAGAFLANTNSSRFHDDKDKGCHQWPGRVGEPPSGGQNAGGNQAKCPTCETKSPKGMPQWWVDEPYINLHVADEPLSYMLSSGQEMTFRFMHKQRYMLPMPDECPGYYYPVLLPNATRADEYIQWMRTYAMTNAAWGHNWMMDILFWDAQMEADTHNNRSTNYARFSKMYEALVFQPDLGVSYYATNMWGTNTYVAMPLGDALTQVRLQPLSGLGYPTATLQPLADTNGIYWGMPATNGFRLVYPDGSQDVLSLTLFRPADGGGARAFLTQRIDPQGRVTSIGYENAAFTNYWHPPFPIVAQYTAFRIKYIVDPDGKTNTFLYNTNTALPYAPRQLWQLAEIDDPYGRKTQPIYDTNGLLRCVSDAAGLTNWFSYQGTNGWLSSLATPYGTTSFSYYNVPDSSVTNGFLERATYVQEPQSANQLFLYLFNNSAVPTNATAPSVAGQSFDDGSTAALSYRNTYHWDRLQAQTLPNTTWPQILALLGATDFRRAYSSHWLWQDDGISISESISSTTDPSPDTAGQTAGERTWYNYPNKQLNVPEAEGDPQPNCIARILPDGSSQYVLYNYQAGLASDNEETYSLLGGGVGLRTNLFQYSTNGVDLLSISNSASQFVNLKYNTNHQVIFATNALSQVTSLTWDEGYSHNLTGVSLPSGLTMGVSLDLYGFIQSISWPQIGATVSLAYTNSLPRTVQVSATGVPDLWQTNFWDGLNRLTGTAYQDASTVSNIYNRLDLAASKDRLGNWTYFGYDGLQHLTAITNANQAVTRLGWCGCGSLTGITNALTNATSLGYNNQGLLTSVIFPDLSSLSYGYDLAGRLTSLTDGSGRTVSAGYNNQGLITTLNNTYGQLWSVGYDLLNRPQTVIDPNGVAITNQYDALNRVTARVWQDGIGETLGYATNGLIAYTNRDQKITRFARDAASRTAAVTNANQEIVRLAYNGYSQVTTLIDGLNHTTSWNYNQFGWLTNKLDAFSREIIRYAYDPNGRVTNRWMLGSGNTAYAYDPVGNLTNITYPGSSTPSVSFAYDALNQLTNMTDAVGTTTFGYTAAGQLQTEATPWSSVTLTYGRTEGHRTQFSINSPAATVNYGYDSAWRLTSLASPAGTFGYSYSGLRSRPTQLTLPNASWITNHYDSLARLDYTALVNPWGHVLDGYGYTHDPLGVRTNIVRDLGWTTNSVAVGYDSIGQLTSWSGKEVGGALRLNEQLSFSFDAAGNLRYRTNSGLAQTFANDAVNQLTNVTRNGPLTFSGVTPVPATNVTVNGQAAQTLGDFTFARTNLSLVSGNNSFTTVVANIYGLKATNITSLNLPTSVTLQYDSNGNLTNDGTRWFIYDAENRLVTNGVASAWKTEFVYDGLGRRRIERDYGWTGGWGSPTNEIHFIYDGFQLIQERNSANGVLSTYTRGPDLSGTLSGAGGIGGLLAITQFSTNQFYYHADGAGNVTALIGGTEIVAARYLYSAFGRAVGRWGSLADANEMQFSSMPVNQLSGIVGYWGRGYDPALQRWMQRDPIGEMGGIDLYRFVGNNPMSRLDPLGLAWYDYIPGLGPGIAQRQGTDAINAMLSAKDYHGMADFEQQHPHLFGPSVSGNPDAIAAAANLLSGSAELYLQAGQQIAMGGIVTKTGAAAAEALEDAAQEGGWLAKVWNKCKSGKNKHHSFPQFLGGKFKQILTDLDPAIHREFHGLLRQNLQDAGIPLDAANASAEAWARYFLGNPGSQKTALEALAKASFSVDAKYGTRITQDLLDNLVEGNFTYYP